VAFPSARLLAAKVKIRKYPAKNSSFSCNNSYGGRFSLKLGSVFYDVVLLEKNSLQIFAAIDSGTRTETLLFTNREVLVVFAASFMQVLRWEIPSGLCAKLRTVAASNNRHHARNLSYYCLLALHI